MIKRCTDEGWTQPLLAYLGSDYPKVPYFYTNLKKYGAGCSNPNVKLWVDLSGEEIQGAYLQYYDCLHFVTREDSYPVEAFLSMQQTILPRVMIVQGDFGAKVAEHLSGQYTPEYNHVIDIGMQLSSELSQIVEVASRADLEKIADLMTQDAEYQAVYDKTVLLAQLYARFDDGYGRCFVIRDGDEIACAYCIYGEVGNFVILSGLITNPNHRRRGYAGQISKHTWKVLHSESKRCVSFVNVHNQPSLALHEKLGAKPIGMLCKLVHM